MVAEQILHIRPVHIRLGKIRIQFDRSVIVLESIPVLPHLDEDGGPVEVSKDILRVDVQDTVHILQSLFEGA